MDQWAALYLVACERLGDENRAGQLVLRARNERQLTGWLQAYGPLPDVLPPAGPGLLEQVTRLRQRSSRRQKLIKTWGAVALVGLVALGGFSLRSLVVDAEPSDPPALVQSEEGQQRLVIHRAEANPEGITIWWSLSGRGLRSQPQMPQFEMIHPEMPGLPAVVQGSRVGKRLEGTAHFNWVLIEPEQIYLKATVGETAHQLQLQPDRSALTAAEKSWPIHKVSAQHGVGLDLVELVQGPGYTLVSVHPFRDPASPFRVLLAPSLKLTYEQPWDHVIDDTGAYLPTQAERSDLLRYAPAPGDATRAILQPDRALVESDLTLPLRPGHGSPSPVSKSLRCRWGLPAALCAIA